MLSGLGSAGFSPSKKRRVEIIALRRMYSKYECAIIPGFSLGRNKKAQELRVDAVEKEGCCQGAKVAIKLGSIVLTFMLIF